MCSPEFCVLLVCVCVYECDGYKVNLFAERATLKNTLTLHAPTPTASSPSSPLASLLQTGRAQTLSRNTVYLCWQQHPQTLVWIFSILDTQAEETIK